MYEEIEDLIEITIEYCKDDYRPDHVEKCKAHPDFIDYMYEVKEGATASNVERMCESLMCDYSSVSGSFVAKTLIENLPYVYEDSRLLIDVAKNYNYRFHTRDLFEFRYSNMKDCCDRAEAISLNKQ